MQVIKSRPVLAKSHGILRPADLRGVVQTGKPELAEEEFNQVDGEILRSLLGMSLNNKDLHREATGPLRSAEVSMQADLRGG